MEKYLWMSSAVVLIGTLRAKIQLLIIGKTGLGLQYMVWLENISLAYIY